MIIKEAYEFILNRGDEFFGETTIERIVIGVHFTAVKLSNGFSGVTKTEIASNCRNSIKENRDFGLFTPGNMQGHKIKSLFEHNATSDLINNVRLAVLNAVSSQLIAGSIYNIIEDKDPIDLLELNGQKTICVVGAFQSYIRKIALTSNKLYVLELNKNALGDEQQKYFVPADKYRETFSKSDIIIITGSTIANKTIDDLLNHIPQNAKTVLVGPSSGLVPDILFNHNIDIIGSTKVINPERMFSIISEGGSGYHLFNYCAKKICIINNKK